jgi:hypothetical protein
VLRSIRKSFLFQDHPGHSAKKYLITVATVLLYGSETWIVKARDTRRITAAEMKYIRTAGYIWTDYKTNTQIAKELKITPILEKLLEYTRNWIQHVNGMTGSGGPTPSQLYDDSFVFPLLFYFAYYKNFKGNPITSFSNCS